MVKLVKLFVALAFLLPHGLEGENFIVFTSTEHDFGRVDAAGGRLYHQFRFLNSGTSTVRLASPVPSCSCVEASITPREVAPGEQGTVEVYLDPSAASGMTLRTVGIYDRKGREIATLMLTATVVQPYPELEELCPVALSETLRASVGEVRFGYLRWGESRSMYFLLGNTSPVRKALSVTADNPALTVECPAFIEPGGTAEVLLSYEFSDKKYRSVSDTLCIFADGVPVQRSVVSTCIRLAPLSSSGQHPSLRVYPSVAIMRRAPLSRKYLGSIEISNSGTSDLHILEVVSTAETGLRAGTVIPPGGKMNVKVSTERTEARLELFTDDPDRPYMELLYKH